MALQSFHFEAGADGAPITTANTGASIVNLGTGGSGTFSNAAAAYGLLGVRLAIAAGQSGAFRFMLADASSNQISVRVATTCLKEAATAGTAAGTFFNLRHASGVVASLRYLKATGRIQLVDGSAGAVLAEFVPESLDTQYRYAMVVNNSTGAWSLHVMGTDEATVLQQSGTATFTQTATFAAVQLGGGLDVASTQDVDALQMDTTDVEIPAPINAPPTVAVTPTHSVPAGETVTVTATASDDDGEIVSYAWSIIPPSTEIPDLAGAATNTAQFMAGPPGSLYTVQCVVTDSGGAQTTCTTEVRVPSTDATVYPIAVEGADGWSIIGNAPSLTAALADSDPATMIESPDLDGSTCRIRYAPLSVRASASITFTDIATVSASTTASVIRIYCGDTLIKTSQLPSITTTPQDVTITLTSAEVPAIADWGNLVAEIVAD